MVVQQDYVVFIPFGVAFNDAITADSRLDPGHCTLLHRSLDVLGVGKCVYRVMV